MQIPVALRLRRRPAAGSFLAVAGLNPAEGSVCCVGSGLCESCRMCVICVTTKPQP
jgi:hypothetical protein